MIEPTSAARTHGARSSSLPATSTTAIAAAATSEAARAEQHGQPRRGRLVVRGTTHVCSFADPVGTNPEATLLLLSRTHGAAVLDENGHDPKKRWQPWP